LSKQPIKAATPFSSPIAESQRLTRASNARSSRGVFVGVTAVQTAGVKIKGEMDMMDALTYQGQVFIS